MMTMTIAESIRQQRSVKGLTDMQYISECRKLAVKRHMDGLDIMVFTFEDGSSISMYWS